MTGVDLLFAIAGFAILAAVWRQMQCERRKDQARARHEQNRRHWRIINRIEQYGYRSRLVSVDDLIDDVLKEAA